MSAIEYIGFEGSHFVDWNSDMPHNEPINLYEVFIKYGLTGVYSREVQCKYQTFTTLSMGASSGS